MKKLTKIREKIKSKHVIRVFLDRTAKGTYSVETYQTQ